jgi:5'-3' exonuclease
MISFDTVLVDGNNLLQRTCYSLRDLTDHQGRPTGGIYGFFKSLASYVKDYNPKKVVVFWDGGRAQWRKELYPDYKKSRSQDKSAEAVAHYEGFLHQMRAVQDLLLSHPVYSIQIRGCEADDLIAYYSLHTELSESKLLVSMDEDFFQLLSPSFRVYSPSKECMIDLDWLQTHYQVTPQEFVILKCFTGDGSDDIVGFPGIGPSRARKIIRDLGKENPCDLKNYISPDALDYYARSGKAISVIDSSNLQTLLVNYKMMNLHVAAHYVQTSSISSELREKLSSRFSWSDSELQRKFMNYDMRSFASSFLKYKMQWKTLL